MIHYSIPVTMHTHEALHDVYEQVPADYWDTSYAQNFIQKLYYDIRFKVIFGMLQKIPQNGSLLDVGCASGFSLNHFFAIRPDVRCYGADIAEHHIAYAKVRRPFGEFIVAPAEKLPYETNFFDAVMMLDVIEHVLDPHKVLKELYRVCAPQGVVIVTVILEHHPLFRAIWWLWLKTKGKVWEDAHLRVYNTRMLLNDMKLAGFENCIVQKSHGTMYVTISAQKS